MSPRAYHLGKRQASVDETKMRIVAAAYALLTAPEGTTGFTMEAVAKQAGVARMTVYYQFGSRRELLEGLFDHLAMKGGIAGMAQIFSSLGDLDCEPFMQAGREAGGPPPARSAREALGAFIRVLTGFYDSDRVVMRRLRGIGAMDPEFGTVMEARNQRRRFGIRMLLQRLAAEEGWQPEHPPEAIEDLLFAITSFETFDQLAGERRDRETVAALLEAMALQTLSLPAAQTNA